MDYAKIGQRIRMYRRAKNLSQEQLAARIGISLTHMSHIETGSTKLSLPVLVTVAETLAVTTDSLLFDTASSAAVTEIMAGCTEKQCRLIIKLVMAVKEFFTD